MTNGPPLGLPDWFETLLGRGGYFHWHGFAEWIHGIVSYPWFMDMDLPTHSAQEDLDWMRTNRTRRDEMKRHSLREVFSLHKQFPPSLRKVLPQKASRCIFVCVCIQIQIRLGTLGTPFPSLPFAPSPSFVRVSGSVKFRELRLAIKKRKVKKPPPGAPCFVSVSGWLRAGMSQAEQVRIRGATTATVPTTTGRHAPPLQYYDPTPRDRDHIWRPVDLRRFFYNAG